MRAHSTGAAFLGPLLLSGMLHAAAIPLLHRTPSAAPAPSAQATVMEELPIDLGDGATPALGVPDGAEGDRAPARSLPAAPPPPAAEPPPTAAPQLVAARPPTATGPAFPAASAAHPTAAPSASAPVKEDEQERLRKLRESVERAMLAPPDKPAGSGQEGPEGKRAPQGRPDGAEGGQGKAAGAGVGYLGGWFSSLVAARSLSLTPEEKAQATAVATVTLQEGQIVSVSLSQPGEIAPYNQAVAAALAGLVGRKVPANSQGEFPSGTFSLRLRAR